MPPRFQPRLYLVDPADFGKSLDAKWRRENSSDGSEYPARLISARWQHEAACRFRAAMIEQSGTLRAFAAKHSLSYATLTDLLRGDVIMRLEDMVALGMTVGMKVGLGFR